MATFDSVLTRDSNGHHGVSVGDADGDGLDDLYVAQPAGLPNRLFRARGDSTFEDVTERAGLGVLDDTAQSLFADVDNDGDQDLVLATGTRPLLFVNDGKGRFAPVPDAFRFRAAAPGRADLDRDGRLRPRRLSRSRTCASTRTSSAPARTRRAHPRRTTMPATARPASSSGTTGAGASSMPRRSRASTRGTTAITSRRRGPTTTATAGPTCSSRTTSAPRTSIATAAGRTGR